MKAKAIILTALVLLASCGQPKDANDLSYSSYLEDFNTDLQSAGHEKIDFSKLSLHTDSSFTMGYAATSNGFNDGSSKVIILSSFFADMPGWLQKLVIYHEIGHAYLGLSHTKDGIMTGDDLQFRFNERINFTFEVKKMLGVM